MLALLGQQIGVVTKAFVNWAPRSRKIFDACDSGVVPPSSMSWSSVRMRTIFGLGWEAADTQKMSWSRQAPLGVKKEEEAIFHQVFFFSLQKGERR